MNNRLKRRLALLLILCIAIPNHTSNLILRLKAEEREELHITNEKEFIQFAKNCQVDSYSKGLVCVLDKDLDFKGKKFTSVPIFYGSFDGKGHEIKGAKIIDAGSILGTFRINEGEIKNLSVDIHLEPTESAESLGLIAGENRGKIYNCKGEGEVKGENNIGGICGVNKESGEIYGCKSYVELSGKIHIGGIAGLNQGVINNSINFGMVNTSENQVNKVDLENIIKSNSLYNLKTDFFGDEVKSNKDVFSCAGGIAGRNSGYIKKSVNKGNIGYVHIGRNVGGIAGISNGFIEDSNNIAAIDGRENVGGIVGQFEPDVQMEHAGSSIDALQAENKKLLTKLRNLNAKVDSTTESALSKGEKINKEAKDMESFVKDTGTGINELSKEKVDIIDESAKKITDKNDELTTSYEKYSKSMINDAELLSDDLNSIMWEVNDVMENMNSEVHETNLEIEGKRANLKADMNQLISLKEQLKQLAESAPQKKQELAAAAMAVDQAVQSGDPVAIRAAVLNFMQIYSSIQNDTNANLSNLALSALTISENIQRDLTDIADTLQNNVEDVTEVNESALENIREDSTSIEKHNKKLREDASELNDIIVEGTYTNHLEFEKIENNSKELFDDVNQDLHDAYEKVYQDASTINQDMSNLITDAKVDSKEINAITSEIISNMEQMSDIMYDLSEKPDYDSKNLFDLENGKNLKGTIIYSNNQGLINGDKKVGGIAGSVGLEILNEAEDRFELDANKWQDTTSLMRAIIFKSKNSGTVKAKENYAGGITGKSMTGYVYDSSNNGNVEGKNFLGGISGYSEGDILNCDVLCDLNGDNHVGGISGFASNMSKNRAMVRLFADGEKLGAIAGEVKEDSVVSENIFVKEKFGGIDNTSYVGIASPISYEEFIKLEDLPAYFDNLYIRFYDGKKLVKSVKVKYMGSIDESEIPKVYHDENLYSEWEDFNKEKISSSRDVFLEHKPWVKTISSGEKVPKFLAEARFAPDATITYETYDFAFEKAKFEAAKEYKYTISGGLKGDSGTYKIRVKLEDGEELKRLKDKKIVNMDYEMDGSYAVFDGAYKGDLLIVMPNYVEYMAFIVLGGILLIITLIFLIKFLRRRARYRLEKKGII